MAGVPEHIHAIPRRLPDIQVVYPEGVLVFDTVNKRIYIGDGVTAGGLPLPSSVEVLEMLEQFDEFKEELDTVYKRMLAVARQQAIVFG